MSGLRTHPRRRRSRRPAGTSQVAANARATAKSHAGCLDRVSMTQRAREAFMAQQALVYIGSKGTVVALERQTGMELWRTPLAGMDFVNVAIVGADLFASARGEVYA